MEVHDIKMKMLNFSSAIVKELLILLRNGCKTLASEKKVDRHFLTSDYVFKKTEGIFVETKGKPLNGEGHRLA